MLKHIIILLTAALGYYAQAYPLQWQLSNVSSSSSSGDHKLTKDSQYYAFLFLTEYDYLQANTIGKTYAKTSVETVCNQIENGSIDNFNKLYAYYTGNSYTTDGTAAFSGQSSSSDWGSATKLSAFVVILDAASLSKASHYMVAECNGEQVLSVYYQTKKELSCPLTIAIDRIKIAIISRNPTLPWRGKIWYNSRCYEARTDTVWHEGLQAYSFGEPLLC